MDLSTKGDQPFVTESSGKTTYVMLNAEIYNYRELIKKYNLVTTSGSG